LGLFWRRLRADRVALAALAVIAALALVALFAPLVTDLFGAPGPTEQNRAALELFLRYAYEQGIARRLMTPEEIFPPGIDVKVAV